jgi:RHS repeat-associated protein
VAADTAEASVYGQVLHHIGVTGASTDQQYTYDRIGRLTQTDDTGSDGVCIRRTYTFDNNTNRASFATAASDVGASCTSTGATATNYSYDSADRLNAAGTVYDAFGRTTQAAGSTFTYYTNDLVRQQKTGNQRVTWSLDAAQRLATSAIENTADGGTTWTPGSSTTNHYGSDADSPDWIVENASTHEITRNVAGITGDLAAITSDTGDVVLQLANLHGDVTVQLPLDVATPPTVLEIDEYGNLKGRTPRTRYGWLGAEQRSGDTLSNLTLMGVRLYDPGLGRFLQTDPVPGGSANAYDYCNGDSVNCSDTSGRCPSSFWKGLACEGAVEATSWSVEVGGVAVCGLVGGPLAVICGGLMAGLGNALGYYVETRWDGGFRTSTAVQKFIAGGVAGAVGGHIAARLWRSRVGKFLTRHIKGFLTRIGHTVDRIVSRARRRRSTGATRLAVKMGRRLQQAINAL